MKKQAGNSGFLSELSRKSAREPQKKPFDYAKPVVKPEASPEKTRFNQKTTAPKPERLPVNLNGSYDLPELKKQVLEQHRKRK